MTAGLHLEDTYGATLNRIKAQGSHKSRLGTTALMWICHSERRLRAEELCQALAVEVGSTDFNPDDTPSIQTVLSCCQGFVVVDEEGSIVKLIHHTLREYLINHGSFFQNPHSTIAETCLTYLNSPQLITLSTSHAQHSSFLEYSSLYWGAHLKEELMDGGKALALKLFSRYECHVSIRLLLEHMLGRDPLRSIVDFYRFTGLHCASIFGLVEVVRALAMMDGVDINGMDETGVTPLIWAAGNGHEVVVQLLLGLEDIDPDGPDFSGRTPMSWAAGNGHEAVVKLLLGREDVSPDTLDFWKRTPISLAAENGHEVVVKLLVGQKDINPNGVDWRARTPISWAAENGHEAVVELLLGLKDVHPDRPDHDGLTPVSWAAGNGHEAVVELLLGREDVDLNRVDFVGQTPISWAARNGHEAVVNLLLGRQDVNPDRPDDDGLTPLSWAARNGHEIVVKLLLERQDVSPNRVDYAGRTPTSWAFENGHEEVVKLFVWRIDDNPTALTYESSCTPTFPSEEVSGYPKIDNIFPQALLARLTNPEAIEFSLVILEPQPSENT